MASGKIDLWSSNTKLAGKIEWSSKSNGSVANTSDVTAGIYVRRTDGYTTKGTWTGEIDFGGGQADFSKPSTSVGSDWVLMQSLTRTIKHDDNGKGSVWIHAECFAPSGTSLAGDSVGGADTVTLDTIPRNSAVSLSKTSFNIGETITIKTNRKSTSFTHTIRVAIGSLSKTLATNVGDSWNWATNGNQDLYGQVYNVASKGGTIYCDCYSGSTLIGTSSVGFTATAVKSSISSNANWTAGNTLTVNISRPSSKYTHTVEVLVNGTSVGTATGVGTSTSFNTTAFHTNVFKALAQTASKATTIKVTTHNGSANLGSTSITGTVTAPAASTANVPTWTAGNTYTASITRANSSFTHTVQLLVGTTSIFTSTGVGTSVTKSDTTFHTNVFKALAQTASKGTTVKVTTYYNGVQVRSQTSKTGTVTAPAASTSTIDNFNIGDTKTITITRANSSFTHKVAVNFGGWTKTLSSSAGTSLSWNTSTDASNMYAKIPNSTSGSGTLTTTTYYNGVQVRSSTSKTFTAYVVNSNPTFTAFTYKDNNSTTSSVTGNNQLQIQNKSNLVVTVTAATPKNSATIKKYVVTINGKNYESTSTTINIGAISKSGTLALQVKAVDSRGLSTSVSKNITVVSYTQPSYTVEVTRKNNYEQETTYKITTGKYDLIPISGSNKNAIQTSQYRYKVSGGSYGSWNAITLTKNGTNFSYSVLVGNLDNTKTYVFQTQIADKLTTITQEFTLKNGTPIMAMRKQSIGINKIPTLSKGLDISGAIKQDGHLYLNNVQQGIIDNKSKIIFGNGDNVYCAISANLQGAIGFYKSLTDKTDSFYWNPELKVVGPEYNNQLQLGKSETRWSNIYSINGNYTGSINLTSGNIRYTYDASGKQVLTGGAAITLGQDQASDADANLRLHSWYGIGFAPTISGQAIPQGENAVYINVRNGQLTARGSIICKGESYNLSRSTGNTYYRATRSDTGTEVLFGVGSGGTNHGIYSRPLEKWMIYNDGSNLVRIADKVAVNADNGNIGIPGNAVVTKKTKSDLGTTVRTFSGNGTSGYINVCRFTITGTYHNQDICFKVLQRNRNGEIKVRFDGGSTTDPSLGRFVKSGNINAYMVKVSTSTWDMYIQKSEGWDEIEIVEYYSGNYSDTRSSITWKDTTVSSLPSGYRTATTDTYYMRTWQSLYDNTSGTTGTVTLSESAANFVNLEIFYKDTKASGYSSVKVYSPNGKVALLDFINEDGTNVRLATSRATISGTSITRSNNQVNYAPATSTYDVNEISIYKVVGYR